MSLKVAILGSGPAAMFAAYACHQQGIEPVIFSMGQKSKMFGAMYLHAPIPGLNDPDTPDLRILISKQGTKQGYARNVYGDENAPCSWDLFDKGYVDGWDLAGTYDTLWDKFSNGMYVMDVTPADVTRIGLEADAIFSTIPMEALCYNPEHRFKRQKIWVLHGPAEGELLRPHDIMIYNGLPMEHGFPWYRYSQINKYVAWEYSSEPTLDQLNDFYTLSKGIKPLSTDCDCYFDSGKFYRLGRFGRWEKGVLTHHAYHEATGHLLDHAML